MDFATLITNIEALAGTATTVIGVVAAVAATGVALSLGRKLFKKA